MKPDKEDEEALKKDLKNFNEAVYLTKYPDIAAGVAAGTIPSGGWHYIRFGRKEGRNSYIEPVTNNSKLWKRYQEFALYHKELENFTEFEEIMAKIENFQNFHLARYNDGEWVFILQIPGHFNRCMTLNNHKPDEVIKISQKLLKVIDEGPEYIIGIDSTTRAYYGLIAVVKDIFKRKLEKIKHVVYGDLFNAATIRFGIKALLNPLRKRCVISVGPEYMAELKIAHQHIAVPQTNCWTKAEEVEIQLDKAIFDTLDRQPVIIYSCSILAKLLIEINYQKYKNSITQLDIGSCIDPWCGVISRPWHKELVNHYQLKAVIDPNYFRE